MTPLTLTQNFDIQTNLSMEQAISIRGEYLTLKTESGPQGEIVSYEYEPSGERNWILWNRPRGMTVHVIYQPEVNGIRVKVTVTPFFFVNIFLLFYGTMSLFLSLMPFPETKYVLGIIPFHSSFGLVFLFLYVILWRRSQMIGKEIKDLFESFRE